MTATQHATELPAPPPEPLRRSFEHCHRIARARARNFYYGLKLTPEPRRSAVYAVYAVMRACDDLADHAAERESPEVGTARIETFRRTMLGVLDGQDLPDDPMWPALRHVMSAYPIDPAYLHAMLDGQVADLSVHRYDTFDDLHGYCYKVASVVGLTCISIWGYTGGAATRKLAKQRGVALQLTNILRDLVEDAGRDRIYLPREDLERFGYHEADLLAGSANAAFDQLMAFQIDRARGFYEKSAELERHIEPSCRPTCWAMMRIYRGLLERIASNPRSVLTRRVRLSSFEKARIAARATWKRTWSR